MHKALKCRKLSLETLMVSPLDCHVKIYFDCQKHQHAESTKMQQVELGDPDGEPS